jgi:ubiquinone biosynthesis monooxygenase Coq6
MLSVTDKLHKLYSLSGDSTLHSPLIWARSTGLEVVNELGPLKAALMGVAGSSASKGISDPSLGWSMAAKSVETVDSALELGKLLASRLGSAALGVAENLPRETSARGGAHVS